MAQTNKPRTGAIPVNAIDEVEPAGAGLHTHLPVHQDAHAVIADALRVAGQEQGMTPEGNTYPAGKPYSKSAGN